MHIVVDDTDENGKNDGDNGYKSKTLKRNEKIYRGFGAVGH